MRRLSNRLFEVYRRIDGVKFHGYLTRPPMSQTKNKLPKRILMVKLPSTVRVGDVVVSPNGSKMILMQHPDHTVGMNMFQVAAVTQEYTWERPVKIMDPVARVLRDNGYQNLGTIYGSMEHLDDLSMEQMIIHQYQILTGQPVQPDDRIGGKIVENIRVVLGVNLVELK